MAPDSGAWDGVSAAPPDEGNSANARAEGRAGARVLVVIVALLAASAVLRAGHGVGRAFAEVAQTEPEVAAEEGARKGSGFCEPEAGIATLLDDLRARESRLSEREAWLAGREEAVGAAAREVEAQLAELAEAEAKLAATIEMADSAAADDVARLVTVYENMKPKEAVPLFEAMDPDFAAGFLGRMRPDAAAAILSGLDPKRGYAISALLAGRNTGAPKE